MKLKEVAAEIEQRTDLEDFEVYWAEILYWDPAYLEWLESLEYLNDE